MPTSATSSGTRQDLPWFQRVAVLVAVLLAMLVLLTPVPALAADDTEPEISSKEVERLIKTLEDDKARAKLVNQLKALRVAQSKAEGGETGVASKMLGALTQRVEALGEQALAASNALYDAPRLVSWVDLQVRNDTARARWIDVLTKLLGLLAAGLALERITALLLDRSQERILARTPAAGKLARVPLVVAYGLLEMMPILGFTLAVHGFLPLLGLTGEPQKAAALLINAYITAQIALVAARILLAPGTGGLRLISLTEESARYLFIWARRLIGVSIYGSVSLNAARLLGLPKSGFEFLFKLLMLLVTLLVVILILQNRQPVAQWLRRRGDNRTLGLRLRQVRNRFADVWHILAALYVFAIYVIWALRIEGGFDYVVTASAWTAGILVGASLLGGLARRLVDRGFAVSKEWRADFPQLEKRANRYLPLLHWVLRALVLALALAAILQAWGMDTLGWLDAAWGGRLLSGSVTIALVVVIALAIWEGVSSSIEGYLSATDADGVLIERSARARTLLPLMRNALMVVLVLTVGFIFLSEIGVNTAPLLAGAGVVGLAIGFGSQTLVKDLIGGLFILFEDTISVGDVVKVGEHAGLVEAMSIRTIRLRDVSGNVHIVPFSAVSTIMNMTKEFSFYVFEVGVAYREDTDAVVEVLKEIGADLQRDPEYAKLILEPLEILGVDRFDSSAVVIKARLKTLPIKQWMTGREFNRRMKKRFDALGIEIPFPHTTVYFGEDKQGRAPPLRMHLERPARRVVLDKRASVDNHGAAVDLPTAHEAGLREEAEESVR